MIFMCVYQNKNIMLLCTTINSIMICAIALQVTMGICVFSLLCEIMPKSHMLSHN